MIMQYYDVNIMQFGNDFRVTYCFRSVSDTLVYHDKSDFNDKIGDRFLCSISRAKNTILGYGKCNDWDYFCTFTLNKFFYDRYNLDKWRKDFSQYLRDMRKSKGYDLKYLLIPEMHKDGAWHLHGLLKGIPWDDLNKFISGVHPKKLVQGGYRYHVGITNKFGFNSFGKLRNRDAAAAYCLKYCGKGFGLQDLDSGTHLYFASHGLNKPVKITDGISTSLLTKPSFQNCYCAISWVKADEVNRIIPYLI